MESNDKSQTGSSPNEVSWAYWRTDEKGRFKKVGEGPSAQGFADSATETSGQALGQSATEACANTASQSPHSSDVWSTARALNVLRESLFSDDPVTGKALEDAARYLGEFGVICAAKEALKRMEASADIYQRGARNASDQMMASEIYREGERVIRKRESDKLRTETRKTSKKKAVKNA